MERVLPGGKGASRWKESFLVGMNFFVGKASHLEKSFLVRRPKERHSGKRASQWEENFPVVRLLPSGGELSSGKAVS